MSEPIFAIMFFLLLCPCLQYFQLNIFSLLFSFGMEDVIIDNFLTFARVIHLKKAQAVVLETQESMSLTRAFR